MITVGRHRNSGFFENATIEEPYHTAPVEKSACALGRWISLPTTGQRLGVARQSIFYELPILGIVQHHIGCISWLPDQALARVDRILTQDLLRVRSGLTQGKADRLPCAMVAAGSLALTDTSATSQGSECRDDLLSAQKMARIDRSSAMAISGLPNGGSLPIVGIGSCLNRLVLTQVGGRRMGSTKLRVRPIFILYRVDQDHFDCQIPSLRKRLSSHRSDCRLRILHCGSNRVRVQRTKTRWMT